MQSPWSWGSCQLPDVGAGTQNLQGQRTPLNLLLKVGIFRLVILSSLPPKELLGGFSGSTSQPVTHRMAVLRVPLFTDMTWSTICPGFCLKGGLFVYTAQHTPQLGFIFSTAKESNM